MIRCLLITLLLPAFVNGAEPTIPDSATYENGVLEFPSGIHYLEKDDRDSAGGTGDTANPRTRSRSIGDAR